jgi:hypothetical protein
MSSLAPHAAINAQAAIENPNALAPMFPPKAAAPRNQAFGGALIRHGDDARHSTRFKRVASTPSMAFASRDSSKLQLQRFAVGAQTEDHHRLRRIAEETSAGRCRRPRLPRLRIETKDSIVLFALPLVSLTPLAVLIRRLKAVLATQRRTL